jgi:hypothetical protein
MAAAVDEQIEVQLPFHRRVLAGACRPVLDGRADATSEAYVPVVSSGKTLEEVGWTRAVIPIQAAASASVRRVGS